MRRLPSSPSRAQALSEFEPRLLSEFEARTAGVARATRDAMHYALFRVEDRFCVTAAWLAAPRLGVSTARLAPLACAIEALRCGLRADRHAAGLVQLAFEMALASGTEGPAAARILAKGGTNVFRATGEILELLAGAKKGLVADWFEKLGHFAHAVSESLDVATAKTLETELLDSARELDLKGAAHEIIEPLADALKARLQ